MEKPKYTFYLKFKDGYIRSSIIPKKKRFKGQDGIKLEIKNSWAKKPEKSHLSIKMKDWEALAISMALIYTVFEKKIAGIKKRGEK